MNLEDIDNVVIHELWGTTNYIVTKIDGLEVFVPDDPNNSDYLVVQEWLDLNP